MSTRREFLGLLGVGAVASAATVQPGVTTAALVCPTTQTHIGVVTVDSHKGRDVHVWLDGEDVTRDCFYADDGSDRPYPWAIGRISGRVKCYKRNKNGSLYAWGLSGDPDPATRRDDCGPSKIYHKVDGKFAWNKPYPGFADVAYEEFIGDVRIVVCEANTAGPKTTTIRASKN